MFEIADPRFAARADAHIELSNKQCQEASVDRVSLSTLDASCRFNAWLWAVTSQDGPELQSKRAQALQILLAETERRFNKHFDEYVQNFDAYVVAQRTEAERAQQP